MSDLKWQKRVLDEERELRDRFNKLETFISGEEFAALPENDRALLQEQRGYMSAYLSVLCRRIDRFAA